MKRRAIQVQLVADEPTTTFTVTVPASGVLVLTVTNPSDVKPCDLIVTVTNNSLIFIPAPPPVVLPPPPVPPPIGTPILASSSLPSSTGTP